MLVIGNLAERKSSKIYLSWLLSQKLLGSKLLAHLMPNSQLCIFLLDNTLKLFVAVFSKSPSASGAIPVCSSVNLSS